MRFTLVGQLGAALAPSMRYRGHSQANLPRARQTRRAEEDLRHRQRFVARVDVHANVVADTAVELPLADGQHISVTAEDTVRVYVHNYGDDPVRGVAPVLVAPRGYDGEGREVPPQDAPQHARRIDPQGHENWQYTLTRHRSNPALLSPPYIMILLQDVAGQWWQRGSDGTTILSDGPGPVKGQQQV